MATWYDPKPNLFNWLLISNLPLAFREFAWSPSACCDPPARGNRTRDHPDGFMRRCMITRATNSLTWKLKILTLFWPINFLHLQLQNNSALGVEVKPRSILKHFICVMYWVLTKTSTLRPRFLPYHTYPTWYSIVQQWAKQDYYARNRKRHYYYRIATKLAKAHQCRLLYFQ